MAHRKIGGQLSGPSSLLHTGLWGSNSGCQLSQQVSYALSPLISPTSCLYFLIDFYFLFIECTLKNTNSQNGQTNLKYLPPDPKLFFTCFLIQQGLPLNFCIFLCQVMLVYLYIQVPSGFPVPQKAHRQLYCTSPAHLMIAVKNLPLSCDSKECVCSTHCVNIKGRCSGDSHK